MEKIKSYTDIEQSKKLAEILPLETADGFWEYHDKWYSEGDEWEGYEDYPRAEPYFEYTRKENEWKEDKSDVPCWSLAVLLKLLPQKIEHEGNEADLHINSRMTDLWYENDNFIYFGTFAEKLIDACVQLICTLNEKGLL